MSPIRDLVRFRRSRDELVWYVTYGSNLDERRFGCYLEGGCPPGGRSLRGCLDPSPPRADRALRLPHRIHFAGSSGTWGGGGVAYLDHEPVTDPGDGAFARAWLITRAQFEGVVAQENGRADSGDARIPRAALAQPGTVAVSAGPYDTIRCYGDMDGAPMVTCTAPFGVADTAASQRSGGAPRANPPSSAYSWTIASGLRQSHGLDDATIARYLASRPGSDPAAYDTIRGWIGQRSPAAVEYLDTFGEGAPGDRDDDWLTEAVRVERYTRRQARRWPTAIASAQLDFGELDFGDTGDVELQSVLDDLGLDRDDLPGLRIPRNADYGTILEIVEEFNTTGGPSHQRPRRALELGDYDAWRDPDVFAEEDDDVDPDDDWYPDESPELHGSVRQSAAVSTAKRGAVRAHQRRNPRTGRLENVVAHTRARPKR